MPLQECGTDFLKAPGSDYDVYNFHKAPSALIPRETMKRELLQFQ